MNPSLIPIWKPVGLTPLEAIEAFKKTNKKYEREKISYAGRLDPMAQGILLLLVGDENKKRKEYEDFRKIYEAEIILGITTDTFDGLGIIKDVNLEINPTKEEIKKCLEKFVGKKDQTYPPYSSKAVRGKPLFWWARENKLSEIILPKKQIEIYSLSFDSLTTVSSENIHNEINENIKKINGDFRQDKIVNSWNKFYKDYKNENLLKIKITISCSSGTYVRRLASDIGGLLSCGGFAISIKRTSVGIYNIKNCFEFML